MPTANPRLSGMGQAALQYARRGWPVFPCRERDHAYTTASGKDKVAYAKAPYTGTGLKDATTNEEVIKGWWRRWPDAMIGLAVGADDSFVLDFDPRHDAETGEEFTLELLKTALEDRIGVPVPASLAVRTPSSGVHVYLREPKDGGEPLRNKVGTKRETSVLPQHVDVRARGGYVILPPSKCLGGAKAAAGEYRWLRGKWDAAVENAPAELVALLRQKPRAHARPQIDAGGDQPPTTSSSPPSADDPATPSAHPSAGGGDGLQPSTPTARSAPGDQQSAIEAGRRRYALSALDSELAIVAGTGTGGRNTQLYDSALLLGTLVAAGVLSRATVEGGLQAIARGWDDYDKSEATIANGLNNAKDKPRDLSAVDEASLRWFARRQDRGPDRGPDRGRGPPSATLPPSGPAAGPDLTSFQNGRESALSSCTEAERGRLLRITERWLDRRIEAVDRTKEGLTKLAYSIGMRVAAGLIEEEAAKERLWKICEPIADVQPADVDRSFDAGHLRGFDVTRLIAELKCAGYPMTDMGNAERFRDRYGHQFRFTTAKGWMSWDKRRWKVLDQEKDKLPAEVMAAVFDTVRAIQSEARLIADTGIPHDENPHGLDRVIPKGKSVELLSDKLRAHGRTSESSGRLNCIANLAVRWLAASIEDFDRDRLAINVLNGTLRFRREAGPDGKMRATVELTPHRREDLNTKLAPVIYDAAAICPLYDGMIEWAQPDAAMRRYLHQWGGYSASGLTGEHKLHFWYGKGRNGKSTTIDMWAHVMGDYSGTIGIETFLDQGIKKRGEQASPDLARLGGVRMLRASEPERGAKLNEALIKAATGGEPMAVRALHRGFFDLLPLFKLTIGGNYRPDIPGTDEGIWARMKLVPWLKNIDLEFNPDGTPKKDPELLDKMKGSEAECSGVFAHLVRGLLDYLANGLIEPAAVKEATQEYRDESDPLARFLRLCTVADPDGRIQSSRLHGVFAAWCKAAGEREWSTKGFAKAMIDKGYKKKASDGMQWLGIRLVKEAHDFLDADGHVRELRDDESPPAPPGDPWADDDDLPP